MPVPGGDVDHNPPPLDRSMLQGSDARPQQRNQSPEQMYRMRPRQQINERAIGIRVDQKSPGLQFAPSRPLSHKKSKTKHHRDAQPRKASFLPERNSGNRLDWSQRRPPRNPTARSFHRQTADQQDHRVDDQQLPRQLHSAPVAKISAS